MRRRRSFVWDGVRAQAVASARSAVTRPSSFATASDASDQSVTIIGGPLRTSSISARYAKADSARQRQCRNKSDYSRQTFEIQHPDGKFSPHASPAGFTSTKQTRLAAAQNHHGARVRDRLD